MRKNNNKLKCAFRPFKGQLLGRGAELPVGGENSREAKPGERPSQLLSFLVCHDPGNEKKFDPGLGASWDLRAFTFSFRGILPCRISCPF